MNSFSMLLMNMFSVFENVDCRSWKLVNVNDGQSPKEQFYKMAVFWVVAPCSLVEVHRRFRGVFCLHYHQATTQKTNLT
jgi:hypothetical protein